MANFIPTGSIGASLGSSLGEGLQQLAQHKVNELLENKRINKTVDAIKSFNPGITNEQARAIAANEYATKAAFERGIEPDLISQLQAYAQSKQQQEPMQFQEESQPFNPQQGQQPSIMDLLNTLSGQQPRQQQFQIPQEFQQPSAFSVPEQQVAQAPNISGGLKLKPTTQERMHQETLKQQRQLAGIKEQREAFKAANPIIKEVVDNAQRAKVDLDALNRFEELEKEGKLDTPGYVNFLKEAGLDIPTLLEPGSQEFQKLEYNFLRNAKNIFGGRITNYEVEQFLKTIPNLSQSPEGRKRVIAGLKQIARGSVEKNKVLRDIIKENNGIPPSNLVIELDERTESKLDKIAEQFKKDLQKEVPKGQNKFITALQTAAGKAIGRLPRAAAGAGLGAAAGTTKFGAAGVVPGAVIGGLAGLSGLGIKDVL